MSNCTWYTQIDYAQPSPRHSHQSCSNERPGTLMRMVARYRRRHQTSLFSLCHVWTHSKDRAKSLLSVWDFPSGPWQRLHIDYAGPLNKSMWLIWIDVFSNYGTAEQVSNANGFNTVRKLQEIFAMLGDPEQIVLDNGSPLTSREFGEFCHQHGIHHIRSSPYYPATNGKA